MSVPAIGVAQALVRRRTDEPQDPHRIPGLVQGAWAFLILNGLSFGAGATLLPVPHVVGQAIAQGALLVALLLALLANPRGVFRPSLFLALLTLLAVSTLMVSIHNEFPVGSTFRACRYLLFVAVLWLLTPWWGRRDMLLLRCHRRFMWVVLGTVLLGALVSPGLAFSFEGRLSGILWPIPPTQVAHYAMVLFGTTAVLWMSRVITGRHALIALGLSGAVLVSTHTRTALLAGAIALLLAAASLFMGHARVRHTSALGAVAGLIGMAVFASELSSWLLRGQSTTQVSDLTGRTKVWSAVFNAPRPRLNDLFGSGLSNQSFDGLPIDSNWVATYLDEGWFGVVIVAAILVLLLLMVATQPRSPRRATALFLIVYCLVASITETGLGAPSPYQLDLTVAVALLVPEARRSSA